MKLRETLGSKHDASILGVPAEAHSSEKQNILRVTLIGISATAGRENMFSSLSPVRVQATGPYRSARTSA